MGVRELSEGIIIQSLADLWDEQHKDKAIKFFSGDGFRIVAKAACLDHDDQIKFLDYVSKALSQTKKNRQHSKSTKKSSQYIFSNNATSKTAPADQIFFAQLSSAWRDMSHRTP